MKEFLRSTITDILSELGIEPVDFSIEHPHELAHGDYACNVAMVAAQKAGTNPRELASIILEKLEQDSRLRGNDSGGNGNDSGHVLIEKIEIAGPGFINITLSPQFFNQSIKTIFKDKDDYGTSNLLSGKRVLVEHSSPNLFKPFHIGHVMNNAIGESVARLAESAGAETTIISYPSDVSLGIGKAVWACMETGVEKLDTYETLQEKLEFLGTCYVEGTKAFDESDEVKTRVREITKHIFDGTAGPELDAYTMGKEINLKYFETMTKRLGSTFADFIYESEAGKVGEKIVRENTPKIFTESDGAIIYEGERDGLHTRVFINAEGYPTYEAKDIGLLSIKFDRFNPDISALVTDYEQQEYYKVVLSAAGKINPNWKDKSVHLTHGRMSFKGQKMSSRLGGVPTAAELLGVLHDEVAERNAEATDELKDMIGIAALKFTILKSQAGKNINFDPETSLSFEGDSGPYLQYTHARCNALLEKARQKNLAPDIEMPDGWVITEVERLLYRMPEIIETGAKNWEPHHVANYLIELARAFNSFYGNTKIIDEDDVMAPYRLALVSAVGQVIKNGLYVLGIEVPERM